MKYIYEPPSWLRSFSLLFTVVVFLAACSDPAPIEPERYLITDKLFNLVNENVNAAGYEKVAEIDHSRLGAETGVHMPPARVIIFSSPALESELMKLQPLVGIDLPLRVLAYERSKGDSVVGYNSYEYLASRYNLSDRPDLELAYQAALQTALQGIPPEDVVSFDNGVMPDQGLIHIESPFDFETTMERVYTAINEQDDTLPFGEVDFAARAASTGTDLPKATLILFGAPEPGALAMMNSPILGLDVFCQKFLVWENVEGQVTLSFNDVITVAERHDAETSIPLRVVNFRLQSVFEEALEK